MLCTTSFIYKKYLLTYCQLQTDLSLDPSDRQTEVWIGFLFCCSGPEYKHKPVSFYANCLNQHFVILRCLGKLKSSLHQHPVPTVPNPTSAALEINSLTT